MARGVLATFAIAIACMAACAPVWCGRLYGEVTQVAENSITASFPAAVRQGSAMIVMSGQGESVAGLAISQNCRGRGPYVVMGMIQWISAPNCFTCGKRVYVDSLNASAIPTPKQPASVRQTIRTTESSSGDLGLYYYASAQKVGAGALGVGFDKVLDGGCGSTLELDGAVTGIAGLGVNKGNSHQTDSLMEDLSARLNVRMAPGGGLYTRYRWSRGKGSDDQWQVVTNSLQGKTFAAPSGEDPGVVTFKGFEYGLSFNTSRKAVFSFGYIPELRTDFGGIGVIEEPARTAEIRYAGSKGGMRIRGLSGSDYWAVDLGITISK